MFIVGINIRRTCRFMQSLQPPPHPYSSKTPRIGANLMTHPGRGRVGTCPPVATPLLSCNRFVLWQVARNVNRSDLTFVLPCMSYGMLIPTYTDSRPAEMSIGKTFAEDSWQMQTVEAAAPLVHQPVAVYREAATGPLRKLSVDLIHTYKHINEVCVSLVTMSAL